MALMLCTGFAKPVSGPLIFNLINFVYLSVLYCCRVIRITN